MKWTMLRSCPITNETRWLFAFFGESKRGGAADASQSAGNEDNRSTHSRCPLNLAAVDNGFELSFIEAAATGRRANLPRPDMIN